MASKTRGSNIRQLFLRQVLSILNILNTSPTLRLTQRAQRIFRLLRSLHELSTGRGETLPVRSRPGPPIDAGEPAEVSIRMGSPGIFLDCVSQGCLAGRSVLVHWKPL